MLINWSLCVSLIRVSVNHHMSCYESCLWVLCAIYLEKCLLIAAWVIFKSCQSLSVCWMLCCYHTEMITAFYMLNSVLLLYENAGELLHFLLLQELNWLIFIMNATKLFVKRILPVIIDWSRFCKADLWENDSMHAENTSSSHWLK